MIPGDVSSAGSEDDVNSEDDSDSREAQYRCQHCFTTTSRDWQQGGKDRSMLCSDCRLYFKKYGELPPVSAGLKVERESGPYLFRPVASDKGESADDSPGRMRTRTRAKEQNAKTQAKRGDSLCRRRC